MPAKKKKAKKSVKSTQRRKAGKAAQKKRAPKKSVQKTIAKKKATRKVTARKKTATQAKPKSVRKARPNAPRSVKRKTAPRATRRVSPPATVSSLPRTIFDLLHPGSRTGVNVDFKDAPDGWTPAQAEALAGEASLTLTDDHWEVIRVLQGCYKDELSPRIRLLRDALEARFADKGGMKYLFGILPGGPIAHGCTLAGLKPPHSARDLSFGSVA